MDNFQVKYSTGKTSRLYDAQVSFQPHKLTLSYLDENGVFCTVDWEKEKINGTRYGASFNNSLTYGDFPFQTINADETFFKQLKITFPQLSAADSTAVLIKKKTWQTIFFSLILVVAFALCSYFYFIPALADNVAQAIPREYEEQLGKQIYDRNMATFGFEVNDKKTRLVNDYFRNLHIADDKNIHITVVNYDEANAFAMPGGYIVLFSGLLDQMQHHEELASVLAHEYAHVHYRHSLRSMARSLANYAVISLVIGDVSGLAGVIVENADNIRSLQYSRELEIEADNYAFEQLDAQKINPRGVIWLFESLSQAHEKNDVQISVPEFLSTHPDTQKRIENIEMQLTNNPKNYSDNERLRRIWKEIKKEQK
ncbi:MAG: M48 family metallopeptidase [Prevotellaceae bacterium]|jgi:predicted Zn-dependent protease|nr:M48 family metallopeptidase [Prevotellaceae bacterium]